MGRFRRSRLTYTITAIALIAIWGCMLVVLPVQAQTEATAFILRSRVLRLTSVSRGIQEFIAVLRTLDDTAAIVPNYRFLDTEVVNWNHRSPVSKSTR